MKHLDKSIIDAIKSQENNQGIKMSLLSPGTQVIVETRNSLYEMTLIIPEKGLISVVGGHFFTKPTKATFVGSTWGSSLLKVDWVGKNMNMEFFTKIHGKILTTRTVSAKIVNANYEYDLEGISDSVQNQEDEVKLI